MYLLVTKCVYVPVSNRVCTCLCQSVYMYLLVTKCVHVPVNDNLWHRVIVPTSLLCLSTSLSGPLSHILHDNVEMDYQNFESTSDMVKWDDNADLCYKGSWRWRPTSQQKHCYITIKQIVSCKRFSDTWKQKYENSVYFLIEIYLWK